MRAFVLRAWVAWVASVPGVAASELSLAAEKRDWPRVETLLSAQADPNAAQADGTTALHWAAYHDRAALVAQLLAAGVKADATNRFAITPLALACQNGSEPIVRALLEAGADANTAQRGGETVLMLAARTGRARPVRLLVEKGAKVDATDRTGQTALMWAAAEGHAEVLSLLVAKGAAVRTRLPSGFTALLFAAREGKSAAVKALLAAGADVHDAIATTEKTDGRDATNGSSAVLLAVENGHFALALDLIQAGADPNDARNGFTVLHTLSWVRKAPRGDDESGQPPPQTSGRVSSLEFARRLVAAGADVNAPLAAGAKGRNTGSLGLTGATPFLLAAKTADLPLMQLLVELGADPQRPNADGATPLMAAAGIACLAPDEDAGTEAECVAACEYLLGLGADPNAVDRRGQTAMHGAAFKSLPKVARLLATRGAKIGVWHQRNDRGWTPLLIAQGFRQGNFKPHAETIAAISEVMLAQGVTPPPPPDRDSLPKKIGYEQR